MIPSLLVAASILIAVALLVRSEGERAELQRLALRHRVVEAMRATGEPLTRSPEAAHMWLAGLKSREGLSPDQDLRWVEIVFAFLKAAEELEYHWRIGVVDDATFRGWEGLVRMFARVPPVAAYRRDRSSLFTPEFNRWHERMEGRPSDASSPTATGLED